MLKSWWKRHACSVTLGIVIILLVFVLAVVPWETVDRDIAMELCKVECKGEDNPEVWMMCMESCVKEAMK